MEHGDLFAITPSRRDIGINVFNLLLADRLSVVGINDDNNVFRRLNR